VMGSCGFRLILISWLHKNHYQTQRLYILSSADLRSCQFMYKMKIVTQNKSTQFCFYYQQWRSRLKLSMRQTHFAGELNSKANRSERPVRS
jgi:hypothetical protein